MTRTFLFRSALALCVFANPAAFPCQYLIIELDAAECAERMAKTGECGDACATPSPDSCCCSCDTECGAANAADSCEVAAEPETGEPDEPCRCCIRVSPDPRVPVKLTARPAKTRLQPALLDLPPAESGGALDNSARCGRALGCFAWTAIARHTLQALLCIWLN